MESTEGMGQLMSTVPISVGLVTVSRQPARNANWTARDHVGPRRARNRERASPHEVLPARVVDEPVVVRTWVNPVADLTAADRSNLSVGEQRGVRVERRG